MTIDGVAYDFEVDCYDAGAGSVIVVGAGEEPEAAVAADVEGDGEGSDTHILVQAYLDESYVGVTIEPDHEGDPEVVYEASLDDELDLVLEGDVIAADDVTFVRNLDLATGTGARVGDGMLAGHLWSLRGGHAARPRRVTSRHGERSTRIRRLDLGHPAGSVHGHRRAVGREHDTERGVCGVTGRVHVDAARGG